MCACMCKDMRKCMWACVCVHAHDEPLGRQQSMQAAENGTEVPLGRPLAHNSSTPCGGPWRTTAAPPAEAPGAQQQHPLRRPLAHNSSCGGPWRTTAPWPSHSKQRVKITTGHTSSTDSNSIWSAHHKLNPPTDGCTATAFGQPITTSIHQRTAAQQQHLVSPSQPQSTNGRLIMGHHASTKPQSLTHRVTVHQSTSGS